MRSGRSRGTSKFLRIGGESASRRRGFAKDIPPGRPFLERSRAEVAMGSGTRRRLSLWRGEENDEGDIIE